MFCYPDLRFYWKYANPRHSPAELIAQWTNEMNKMVMMRSSNGMVDPGSGGPAAPPHVQPGMPPHGPGPGNQQPGSVTLTLLTLVILGLFITLGYTYSLYISHFWK